MLCTPKTITESIQFNTIRLSTNASSGTGFYFDFKIKDNRYVPTIITNKHVVNYKNNEPVSFFVHTKNGEQEIGDSIKIDLCADWFFHENPEIDLCFCFAQPLFSHMRKQLNKEIFYMPIQEDYIFDKKKLEENLSAVEDIIMVGYPNGLWNEKSNLPIFRKGITANHPSVDFNKDSIGIIDSACFPGSSGSPIFIVNENGYMDKNKGLIVGESRVIFLGVLFGGPIINAKGTIEIKPIPTNQDVFSSTKLMINLGYYVKSIEILSFKKIINERLSQHNK